MKQKLDTKIEERNVLIENWNTLAMLARTHTHTQCVYKTKREFERQMLLYTQNAIKYLCRQYRSQLAYTRTGIHL